METLLLYFGKVIVCSGITFLYYRLSLKDRTFHHYNRFYLLSAMLISILLPLIKIEDFTIEVSSSVYRLIDKVHNFNTYKNTAYDHIYFRIIFSALGFVSFFFLGRFIYGIVRIGQLKSRFPKEHFGGINFYRTNLAEAPFSYFRNLFWKNSIMLDSDIGKQILKHEMVHIEQKHSFDKIFIEIITSVFWFNPFFYLIRKEISLIHEYLADKKAVRQSDTKAFAQMLLASHFSGTALPATSPFLSSNLKKRLKMLQKPKTRFGYVRRIFALPVVFSVAFAYMVNAKNQEIKATNIEIEKTVSRIEKQQDARIKTDTVTPDASKTRTAVVPGVSKRSADEKKIADLSKQIQERTATLKKISPESKDYDSYLEEIGKLSGEIGKIAGSEKFLKSVMVIKTDGRDVNINEYFKSAEWKDKIRNIGNMKYEEIPELPEIPELKVDLPDLPPLAVNIPNTPKVQIYSFRDAKNGKWSPEMKKTFKLSRTGNNGSAADVRKRAELERKRAKIDSKIAKVYKERIKLEAERMALNGNRKAMVFSNTFKNFPEGKMLRINADNIRINQGNQTLNASGIKSIDGADNMRIYFDGKEVTKQELESLNPDKIKSMNINKKKVDGGETSGEIRIETKK